MLYIITLSSVCLSCSIAVLTENIRSASQTFQTAVDWRYAFNQPTRHNNEVVTRFIIFSTNSYNLTILLYELKLKQSIWIIWETISAKRPKGLLKPLYNGELFFEYHMLQFINWPGGLHIKVHIFWEGHKSSQNLHLGFDWHYIEQK